MSNLLLYALISIGTLVALFLAGCLYLAVSYSDDGDDEDDDYEEEIGWK